MSNIQIKIKNFYQYKIFDELFEKVFLFKKKLSLFGYQEGKYFIFVKIYEKSQFDMDLLWLTLHITIICLALKRTDGFRGGGNAAAPIAV